MSAARVSTFAGCWLFTRAGLGGTEVSKSSSPTKNLPVGFSLQPEVLRWYVNTKILDSQVLY